MGLLVPQLDHERVRSPLLTLGDQLGHHHCVVDGLTQTTRPPKGNNQVCCLDDEAEPEPELDQKPGSPSRVQYPKVSNSRNKTIK